MLGEVHVISKRWKEAGVLLLATITGSCDQPSSGDSIAALLPTWSLSETPIRVIADSGEVSTVFQQVTPRRLTHGDILAADVGSRELRLFREGRYLKRLSRQGEGPGELSAAFLVALAGDTIYTIGTFGSGFPINVFTVESGFLAQFRLVRPAGAPRFYPVGRLRTGGYVVEEGGGFQTLPALPRLGQLVPDSVTVGLFRRDATDSTGSYQTIGRFRRRMSVPHRLPGGPVSVGLSPSPLAPTTAWVVSGDLLWICDAETGAIVAYNERGTMVVSDTVRLSSGPFDGAALKRARDSALGRAENDFDRSVIEAIYDPGLVPAAMPLFSRAEPGHNGELWLRLFELEPARTHRYLVLNRSGAAVAQVEVPFGVSLHQVGIAFLLGVRRDPDGREEIVEYKLQRGGP